MFVRVFLLLLFVSAAALRGDETDFVERDLQAAGLEPSERAIREYLEAIRPSDVRSRRIRENITLLGHEDFATRERATRNLIATPKLGRERMVALLDHPDPEVRARARYVLRRGDVQSHRSRMIPVLLWTIRERPEDICPILLDVLDEWVSEPYVMQLCGRAVAATARAADVPTLRSGLAGTDPFRRVVCLRGLARLGRLEEVEHLVDDADESVRLAAATVLLDAGRRNVLGVIVELCGSEVLATRIASAHTLRYATGRSFGFAAYDPVRRRKAALAEWGAWIERNRESMKLRLPIPHRQHVERGRTLIGLYTEKRLREIDARGNVVWETAGFTYPWGCHALPNGHRLAVDYDGRFLVEYDGYGRRIWLVKNLPGKPTDVKRLDDGNTLVTLADPGLVVEIAPNEKIVWQRALEGRPSTAQRLENGRTLVCLQSARRVVEIDREGNVLWQINGLRSVHTAQRLDNGNTLVCQMDPGGRVAEFDPEGSLVWENDDVNNPAQAQRLADGTTIVSGDGGLFVFDTQGRMTRRIPASRSRFHAF